MPLDSLIAMATPSVRPVTRLCVTVHENHSGMQACLVCCECAFSRSVSSLAVGGGASFFGAINADVFGVFGFPCVRRDDGPIGLTG